MYHNLTLIEGDFVYVHSQQRWDECSVLLCVYRIKFPVWGRRVVGFLLCFCFISDWHYSDILLYNPRCFIYWLTYSYLPPRYRITIGNKTCVFEKENDPSVMRSPSAGKLIQYIVEDGGHVFAGQCYAEIEVSVVVGLSGHGRVGGKVGKASAGMD